MEKLRFQKIRIRPLSKREKSALSAVFVILALSLIFNIVMNIFGKLEDLSEDINRKKNLLNRHFSLISKGNNIRALYEGYKDVLSAGSTPEEAENALFTEVKDLAGRLNLVIDKIKPLPMEVKRDYKKVFLEIELGGNLRAIFEFINELEKSPSFIKILSLRLYPPSGKSDGLRSRITLSRVVF